MTPKIKIPAEGEYFWDELPFENGLQHYTSRTSPYQIRVKVRGIDDEKTQQFAIELGKVIEKFIADSNEKYAE